MCSLVHNHTPSPHTDNPVSDQQNYQHRARKRFGQNFLRDEHIINRIVHAIVPGPNQTLIEIGPGQGALTEPLLDAAGRLTAIEIDRDLAAQLRSRYADKPGFHLIEGDVLDVDFATLAQGPAALRIVGNLPYNISTPLLFRLLLRVVVLLAWLLLLLLLWHLLLRLLPLRLRLGVVVLHLVLRRVLLRWRRRIAWQRYMYLIQTAQTSSCTPPTLL